ncbi:hypothetical protein DFA_11430 [Cavenderia fasciculata]|uniref:Ankyrin repeat-containing protein n=1 Tax=Cavenderia fasciculata TaxID=261658 RepID=F4QCY8_CACFS|nr:uncharacterized protein DFA_11430 [Cavenderia fasciculata]EGG13669.1 hypothetical protein DFA_11430 [Cavenderia fasciculata]|eukprot:XP_004350373.1 hypothetical protein DFA_11430 [Cavenderia fasciculata]
MNTINNNNKNNNQEQEQELQQKQTKIENNNNNHNNNNNLENIIFISSVFKNKLLFKNILKYCKVQYKLPLCQIRHAIKQQHHQSNQQQPRHREKKRSNTEERKPSKLGFKYTSCQSYDDWFSLEMISINGYYGLLKDRLLAGRPLFIDQDGVIEFLATNTDADLFFLLYNRYASKFVGPHVIMSACEAGVLDIVRTLVDNLKPDATSLFNALKNAVQCGHLDVVELLFATNPSITNHNTDQELSYLFASAISCNADTSILKSLLKHVLRNSVLPPTIYRHISAIGLQATCLIAGEVVDIAPLFNQHYSSSTTNQTSLINSNSVSIDLALSYVRLLRYHHTIPRQLSILSQLLMHSQIPIMFQLNTPPPVWTSSDDIVQHSCRQLAHDVPIFSTLSPTQQELLNLHNIIKKSLKLDILLDDCLVDGDTILLDYLLATYGIKEVAEKISQYGTMNQMIRAIELYEQAPCLKQFEMSHFEDDGPNNIFSQTHLNSAILRSDIELTKYIHSHLIKNDSFSTQDIILIHSKRDTQNNQNNNNSKTIKQKQKRIGLEMIKLVMEIDQGSTLRFKHLTNYLLSKKAKNYVMSFGATATSGVIDACWSDDRGKMATYLQSEQLIEEPWMDIIFKNASMGMVDDLLNGKIHSNFADPANNGLAKIKIQSRSPWRVAAEIGDIQYLELVDRFSSNKNKGYEEVMAIASRMGRLKIMEYIGEKIQASRSIKMILMQPVIRFSHQHILDYYFEWHPLFSGLGGGGGGLSPSTSTEFISTGSSNNSGNNSGNSSSSSSSSSSTTTTTTTVPSLTSSTDDIKFNSHQFDTKHFVNSKKKSLNKENLLRAAIETNNVDMLRYLVIKLSQGKLTVDSKAKKIDKKVVKTIRGYYDYALLPNNTEVNEMTVYLKKIKLIKDQSAIKKFFLRITFAAAD